MSSPRRRSARQTFLVEQYWPGVTPTQFEAAVRLVAIAVEAGSGPGAPVRLLHSTYVPEDEAAVCVFQAAAADDIARAFEAAGVRYDRIVPAIAGDPRGRRHGTSRSPEGTP